MNNLSIRKSLAILLCSTLVLPLGSGCNLTPAELSAMDLALNGPSSDWAGEVGAPAPSCFAERFTQPDAVVNRKIDLLFVTDTSGSLVEERGQIADGIDSFIAALPGDADVQIAVMQAHSSRSSFSGRLWHNAGHGPVLKGSELSSTKLRSELRYLLTHSSSDIHGDGGELGMYSLMRAMDSGPLTSSRAKGFFREDAALAVVFIADENDICAKYPAGVRPVADPDGYEAPAKKRDCGGVTPQAVIDKVKAMQGDRPLLFGGIIYNNHATYPRTGENEFGYGYHELLQLAGGASIDLAGGHYNEGLAEIGTLATVKMNLVSDFTLARPGVDAASIQVSVDGVSATHAYNATTNVVSVTAPGIARSVVDISYCLTPEPTPSPSCSPSATPTPDPTATPSSTPTSDPTPDPTASPSATPTSEPTPDPTATPTPTPTASPSPTPPPCEGPGCGGGGVIGV